MINWIKSWVLFFLSLQVTPLTSCVYINLFLSTYLSITLEKIDEKKLQKDFTLAWGSLCSFQKSGRCKHLLTCFQLFLLQEKKNLFLLSPSTISWKNDNNLPEPSFFVWPMWLVLFLLLLLLATLFALKQLMETKIVFSFVFFFIPFLWHFNNSPQIGLTFNNNKTTVVTLLVVYIL